MELMGKTGCRNNDTYPDVSDDYYLANFKIFLSGVQVGDIIELSHSHLLEQDPQFAVVTSQIVSQGYAELYSNKMRTDINITSAVPGHVPMGNFTITIKNGSTGATECTADISLNGEDHTRPCSVCTADQGAWNTPVPDCWPDELPTEACNDVLNHAPDPDHLEHTPLKYVKVMLHIFQVADSGDPNQPYNGPQHFTSSDIDAIKSWINGPQGANDGKLANICPAAPAGSSPSPYIPDSRIRFLLEHGEEGKDIFFHPNTTHWGISLQSCGSNPNGSPDAVRNFYVTNPSPTLPPDYVTWIQLPENRNALHIFISRGRWIDMNGDGPDPNLGTTNHTGPDCFNPSPGGYTWPDEAGCTDTPAQYVFGLYDMLINPNIDPSVLGQSLTGEFFHVMGLDHPSPFQIHHQHDVGEDGCADTDGSSNSNNMLGCNFTAPRCNLTQCQMGRMHSFFENEQPGFERFLVGQDANGKPIFSMEGNCKIVEPDIVIHNGETVDWKGPRRLRSNILVETGGKLVIRCRIGMPESARITVQKGGRLSLYGEVYNNCTGKRWQGFVVNGNSGLPQTFPPVNQGYFLAFNGSIIEGANTSIRVESGGMALVTGCSIRNAGGALFEPYSHPNVSRFNNCNFTCNGNVFAITNPYFHAALQGVRGVKFTGCDFSVSNVPQGQLLHTTGINGDGSNFNVAGSTFTGFDTGVHADGGVFSPFKSITVDNCTFTNNQTGVFTLGMQNCVVTRNTFYIKGASSIFDNPTGLMMDNSTGYVVEKNYFYKATNSAMGRYGTITEDSGPDANFIKGNFFKNLERGNFAQGNNRGFLSGLQYWCNTDEDNVATDFYVEGVGAGIHTSQGNGKATMNVFTHTGNDFQNNLAPILYYYKQNDAAHEPLNSVGIDKIEIQTLNTCPGGGGTDIGLLKLTSIEWANIENDFYTARTGWNAKKAQLLALLDGGNTASLLAQINGATALNAGQVSQQLLNLSPYLSTQALSAAIAKKQVLTENAVVQVLNANPDGLRASDIYNLVKTSFSTTVANGILANTANQTSRTTLENEAGQYRATMQHSADLLLIDIANDSLQADLGLLRTWLANKESIEASYAVVGTYLSVGDFTTALQQLSAIPHAYSFDTQEEMAEHGYFEDLVDLWEAIYTSGSPIYALDSATIASLKYIADNSKLRAGAMAQGALNTWYDAHYRVIPGLPIGGTQAIVFPPSSIGATAAAGNYLTAFPNPAKGNVTFKWDLPNDMEKGTIVLSDLQGRNIEVLKISGQHGKMDWNAEKLNDGVYLYQIRLPNGTTATSKLVIIK